MKFEERLKNLREDRDEKQKDIAKILYVSPNMVSSYELGKHFPKNESSLKALAEHFKVSTDYLLGYSDVPRYDNIEKYTDILTALNGLDESNYKSVIDYILFLKCRQK